MKLRNVLAVISPMSAERVSGIAQYAKEHGWNLMLQDRLGHTPLARNGDGILATLRSDPVTFRCIGKLMKRGIPLVDLTVCPFRTSNESEPTPFFSRKSMSAAFAEMLST